MQRKNGNQRENDHIRMCFSLLKKSVGWQRNSIDFEEKRNGGDDFRRVSFVYVRVNVVSWCIYEMDVIVSNSRRDNIFLKKKNLCIC